MCHVYNKVNYRKLELKLLSNKGYKWKKIGNVFFKGNFSFNNKLFNSNSNSSVSYIEEEFSIIKQNPNKVYGQFIVLIKEANGSISIVTDLVRSFNLFYREYKNGFIVSDDINNVVLEKEKNIKGLKEFKYTGFITEDKTIYKNVNSLESCMCYNLDISRKITKKEYFKYIYNENKIKESELLKEIDFVYDLVFKDLIRNVKNKTIIIPLSGGYDSRIIVHYLSKFKVPNKVICFTYGVKGNEESIISKEVAAFYGFEWVFIEYTKSKWRESKVLDYVEKSFDGVSLPHIQDFLAVKELKKKKIIPKDSVFIPGHSGDFIAGSHIHNRIINCTNEDDFIKEIVWKNYILNFSFSFKNLMKIAEKNTEKYKGTYVNRFEEWSFKERQSKFIVNSARVYENFGYEWLVPLWDIRLVDFWMKIDNDFRYNRNLYFQFISPIDKWHKKSKKQNIIQQVNGLKYFFKWFSIFSLNIKNLIKNNSHPMGWYEIFSKNKDISYSSINSLLAKYVIKKNN